MLKFSLDLRDTRQVYRNLTKITRYIEITYSLRNPQAECLVDDGMIRKSIKCTHLLHIFCPILNLWPLLGHSIH